MKEIFYLINFINLLIYDYGYKLRIYYIFHQKITF